MRIAVPVTEGIVDGPGEGEEVFIFETGSNPELLEKYPNPALTATSARGIWMLRSAMDRDVDTMIVSGIGQHAFTAVKGSIKFYHADGVAVDDAVKMMVDGKLKELTEPNHNHSHHH